MHYGRGGLGHKAVSSPQGQRPLSIPAMRCYQFHVRAVCWDQTVFVPARQAVSITSLSVLLFHPNSVFYVAPMLKQYASFVFWRDMIRSLKPLPFSSKCIFQLPITFSSARALFPQAKHTLFRRGEKELARFQAPSLPICKPGLIWVSKRNVEVPRHITEAHSSDQTGSRLHISNHSNRVILKGSVMGNVWHDSNWERKKLSMHGSIPQ